MKKLNYKLLYSLEQTYCCYPLLGHCHLSPKIHLTHNHCLEFVTGILLPDLHNLKHIYQLLKQLLCNYWNPNQSNSNLEMQGTNKTASLTSTEDSTHFKRGQKLLLILITI